MCIIHFISQKEKIAKLLYILMESGIPRTLHAKFIFMQPILIHEFYRYCYKEKKKIKIIKNKI